MSLAFDARFDARLDAGFDARLDPLLFAPLQSAPPPLAGVLYAEDFDLLDAAVPFGGSAGGSAGGNPFTASPGVVPVTSPAAAPCAATRAAPAPEVAVPAVLLTEADLEEARRIARAEGAAAAMAAAEQQAAQTGRRALDALALSLGDARAEGARLAEEHAEAVARLVLSALAASLPATCAHHGETEVRALVGALLPHLAAEPQVVIRCSPHDADGVRAELDRLGPDAPASAQVVPTDAVMQGNVRVTWQGGSAARDVCRAWDAVQGALVPLGLLQPADAPTHVATRALPFGRAPHVPRAGAHDAATTKHAAKAVHDPKPGAASRPALQNAEMEDA